jgi:hypothetical protein
LCPWRLTPRRRCRRSEGGERGGATRGKRENRKRERRRGARANARACNCGGTHLGQRATRTPRFGSVQ